MLKKPSTDRCKVFDSEVTNLQKYADGVFGVVARRGIDSNGLDARNNQSLQLEIRKKARRLSRLFRNEIDRSFSREILKFEHESSSLWKLPPERSRRFPCEPHLQICKVLYKTYTPI